MNEHFFMKGRHYVFFLLFLLTGLVQQSAYSQCSVSSVPVVSYGCSIGDAIDSFSLAGVSTVNNYGCSGTTAYTLYTNPVRTLYRGNTYTFSATTGISGNYPYTQYFAIWLDIDNDGFYDSSELVYSSYTTKSNHHSGFIYIPNNITSGTLRMRTRCSYDTKLEPDDACTQVVYGETEDYYVNIVQPCSGPPSIVQQPSDTMLSCGYGSTRFSVGIQNNNNNNNVQYQWQIKAGFSWSNLNDNNTYNGTSTQDLDIMNYTPDFSGNKYRCVVNNSCGAVATQTATLGIEASPIDIQPVNAAVCENSGTAIPFTVSTAGSGSTHTYQWYVKKSPNSITALVPNAIYSGVDTPLLVMSTVDASMDGYKYFCTVDGGCWSTDTVELMVKKQPVITQQPEDDTVCVTKVAVFTVGANGSNLHYQWQYHTTPGGWQNLTNNNTYSNVNTASLIAQNPDLTNNGKMYRCEITGDCDTVYTQIANLIVYDDFTIATQPHDSTACINTTATFRVGISSTSPVTYQWMKVTSTGMHVPVDTPLYLNASSAELTVLSATQKLDSTEYYCVISNRCKTDTTRYALLVVDPCGSDNMQTEVPSIPNQNYSIQVYPNPANGGKVSVATSFNLKKGMVKVVNRMGIVVISVPYQKTDDSKIITLDIDRLPRGVYSIQVYDTEQSIQNTTRFIKD